jgi:FkbM family methyltransferase
LTASFLHLKLAHSEKIAGSHMNELEKYQNVFAGIAPWSGKVSAGFMVDFLGILTDVTFRTPPDHPLASAGRDIETRLPIIEDGEGWFEAANWFEAAREASEQFVMITLGACYGAQAVGSYRAVQLVNPMPCKLVAVEPEPDNYEWTRMHMRDNGIDPDDQWLVQAAISDKNDPVLFPVGAPGTGAQNCLSTNEFAARQYYASEILRSGRVEDAIKSLLLFNTTGVKKDLVPGENLVAEVKVLSAVTLKDVLSPFDRVDYLESDIQQSEILVFPPFIELLRRKVQRIHIGTHGADVHHALHKLFEEDGWEIVFSYAPNSEFQTSVGNFTTNDGVLTVRNPRLTADSTRSTRYGVPVG